MWFDVFNPFSLDKEITSYKLHGYDWMLNIKSIQLLSKRGKPSFQEEEMQENSIKSFLYYHHDSLLNTIVNAVLFQYV